MRLFLFLKNLFVKKQPPAEERYDLYEPSSRAIYSYFDGKNVVSRDPIVLYRKVAEVGQELSVDIRAANSVLSAKIAAAGQAGVVKKIKQIFGVTSFEEGGGLTETELMALLDHFLEYCDRVKKNSNPLTTTTPEISSTSTTDTKENTGNTPPTTPTPDSSSTKEEEKPKSPPSSPEASA